MFFLLFESWHLQICTYLSCLISFVQVDHYILDIDLDFYSTLNPFVSLYSEAGLYDRLRELYR